MVGPAFVACSRVSRAPLRSRTSPRGLCLLIAIQTRLLLHQRLLCLQSLPHLLSLLTHLELSAYSDGAVDNFLRWAWPMTSTQAPVHSVVGSGVLRLSSVFGQSQGLHQEIAQDLLRTTWLPIFSPWRLIPIIWPVFPHVFFYFNASHGPSTRPNSLRRIRRKSGRPLQLAKLPAFGGDNCRRAWKPQSK